VAPFVPRPTRVLRAPATPERWEDVVGLAAAGLIVAGDGASPCALEWSQTSGFPLLAEPASGAWASGGVVPFEQSLVASSLGREVDTVVVTGRPTLSRPIQALLARPDVRVVDDRSGLGRDDEAPKATVHADGRSTILAPGLPDNTPVGPIPEEEATQTGILRRVVVRPTMTGAIPIVKRR